MLIQASREGLVATVKSFDEALARQQASRQRKEELAMVKRLKITQEEYIDAIYFLKCTKHLGVGIPLKKQNTNTTS